MPTTTTVATQGNYLEFDILAKTELLAHIKVNFDTRQVNVEQFTNDPVERPFLKESITPEDIMDYLEDRCFPETRANCDQLLNDLGLTYYSPLAIVRKTHGLQFDDYIWVRFAGEEISYDSIKIRA